MGETEAGTRYNDTMKRFPQVTESVSIRARIQFLDCLDPNLSTCHCSSHMATVVGLVRVQVLRKGSSSCFWQRICKSKRRALGIGMGHVQVTQRQLRFRRRDDSGLRVTRSWRPSPRNGRIPAPRGGSMWFELWEPLEARNRAGS